ncbi:hypothetical protein P692DRAFT_20831694 [Suillus brevipes Sb2]|nr:hypothetical protein P692DRAFT_20831694 [Suillus brevipes Sb2]
MSYFTPAANANVNKSRGHSQVSSHHTSFSSPAFGGGYTQSPPPTRNGGFIPPPVGAMQSSGQKVLDCPRCREILPPGLDLATHLIGCGAAALLTNAFTPFDYPSRPQRSGGRPPNF